MSQDLQEFLIHSSDLWLVTSLSFPNIIPIAVISGIDQSFSAVDWCRII